MAPQSIGGPLNPPVALSKIGGSFKYWCTASLRYQATSTFQMYQPNGLQHLLVQTLSIYVYVYIILVSIFVRSYITNKTQTTWMYCKYKIIKSNNDVTNSIEKLEGSVLKNDTNNTKITSFWLIQLSIFLNLLDTKYCNVIVLLW